MAREGSGGALYGFALPTSPELPERIRLFPFVEVHTALVAWWLTVAWRTRQLAEAGTSLLKESQPIASAACVRAFAETAAQFWVDSGRIAQAWDDIKAQGFPGFDADSYARRTAIMSVLNEVLLGSKFDDKAPDLKETFGLVSRGNVLTGIGKLTGVVGQSFQDDYQWLCNTVHPSMGNFFAFSSPPVGHETGTHSVVGFHGRPVAIKHGEDTHAVTHLREAIERALTHSAVVLHRVLDASLRVVDDVGLTTGAPQISARPYWRDVRVTDDQLFCPCRSGRRAYRCRHAWGGVGPKIPRTFTLPTS